MILKTAKYRELDERISSLEKHRRECDHLHEEHVKHNKRHDDSMKSLTESNLMLSKSITDMNITLTRLTAIIDNDRPIMKALEDAGVAWDVNKKILLTLAAVAAATMSIVAAYNYFW